MNRRVPGAALLLPESASAPNYFNHRVVRNEQGLSRARRRRRRGHAREIVAAHRACRVGDSFVLAGATSCSGNSSVFTRAYSLTFKREMRHF